MERVFATVTVFAFVVKAIVAAPADTVKPPVVTIKPPAVIVAPPVIDIPVLVIVVPPVIEAPPDTVINPSPRTLKADPPELRKSRKVNPLPVTVPDDLNLIKLLVKAPPVKEFDTVKVFTAAWESVKVPPTPLTNKEFGVVAVPVPSTEN